MRTPFLIFFAFITTTVIFAQTNVDNIDWRVEVILKSGKSIKGVVRFGRFAEKIVNGVYQKVERPKPSVGVRIWYVDNNPGFIYIPYTIVKKGIKIAPFDQQEKKVLRELHYKIKEERLKQRQQRIEEKVEEKILEKVQEKDKAEEEVLEKVKAEKKPKIDEKKIQELAKAKAFNELPQEYRELLKEFPPQEGWGEERYKQFQPRIARNKALFGTPFRQNISSRDVNFNYKFKDWKGAFDAWMRITEIIAQDLRQNPE